MKLDLFQRKNIIAMLESFTYQDDEIYKLYTYYIWFGIPLYIMFPYPTLL